MPKVKTERYSRRPFFVDAVQVTAKNMEAIAEWCSGTIETTKNNKRRKPAKYIQIDVHSPATERQAKAFIGDWVLLSGTNFKVYTKSAFAKAFQKEKHNARMAQGKRAKVVRDSSGVRVVAAEGTYVPGPNKKPNKKERAMSNSNNPSGEQAGERQDPSEPKRLDVAQPVVEQPAEPEAPEAVQEANDEANDQA